MSLSDIEINAKERADLEARALDGSSHYRRRLRIFDRTGGLCWHCCCTLGFDWHGDHLRPRADGGTNDISNMVPSCRACNLEKADRLDWIDGKP